MRVPLTSKRGTELLFNECSLFTARVFSDGSGAMVGPKASTVASACEQLTVLMRDVSLQSATRTY